MADKKKAPMVEAPVVDKKPAKKEEKAQLSVLQMGDLEKLGQSYTKNGGLDANRRMDMLTNMRIMFHDDPMIAKHLGIADDTLLKINVAVALGNLAALMDEVQYGPSGWAAKMRVSQLEELKVVAPLLGVEVDMKSLPAPDKNGEVEVSQKTLKISDSTKKKMKEAKAINDSVKDKPYLNDHTKIETDEQLHEALGFQLVNREVARPVDRLITAAQFLRAYREARAENADDPQAELAKIHECTITDFLQDISTMVPPTFVFEGFGKYLCGMAASSKSVVPAFNMLKRAAYNKTTKKYALSDTEIAAITRMLIVWNSSAQIAEISNSIKNYNKTLTELNKKPEANAKGIESAKSGIEKETNKIHYFQSVIGLVSEPDFEIADQFIAAYNNSESPLHKQALSIYDSVIKTYYENVEIPELEFDSALLNVQQRIGIILNLFNSPTGQREEFSEENLIEVGTVKEEPEQKNESKNS